MSDQLVTIVGTVCKEDPTLKFSPQGHAICEFSIRIPGQRAKEGRPATEAKFMKVVAWRDLGEHVAESVRKDDRLIVQGTVKTETWDGKDGEKKSAEKMNAWNVGVELSFVNAEVVRTERKEPAAAGAGFGDF